jgi:hypothetical protein
MPPPPLQMVLKLIQKIQLTQENSKQSKKGETLTLILW